MICILELAFIWLDDADIDITVRGRRSKVGKGEGRGRFEGDEFMVRLEEVAIHMQSWFEDQERVETKYTR